MKIDVILKLNMTAARFECFAVDHGVDNIAAAVAEFDGFIGSGQHGIDIINDLIGLFLCRQFPNRCGMMVKIMEQPCVLMHILMHPLVILLHHLVGTL